MKITKEIILAIQILAYPQQIFINGTNLRFVQLPFIIASLLFYLQSIKLLSVGRQPVNITVY